MTHWVVGVPASRRVAYWSQALEKYGIKPQVFSYEAFLETPITGQSPTTLRIESPGEDFATEQFLLQQGLSAGMLTPSAIKRLEFDRGIIRYARQWYAGWHQTLLQIQDKAAAIPDLNAMNSPTEIALMFDKLACQQHLSDHGVRVPANLGVVENAAHLFELIERHRRLFIKPRYGSSASGVMALQSNSAGRLSVITSIELVTENKAIKLYNNLKVSQYNNPKDVAAIINTLAPNGLYCEAWVPKKSVNGMVSDVRVLVIDCQACHFVLRRSKKPITNTHLGNSKSGIDEAIAAWGQASVEQIKTAAEAAAKTFPNSFYCGVDVMLGQDNKAYVLEVNAFGDMLLDSRCDGLNTYEMELQKWQGSK